MAPEKLSYKHMESHAQELNYINELFAIKFES